MRSQLAFIMVAACCCGLHADVTFEWARIGNPGNANDTTGFGGVSYEYDITKHEVTNTQYAEFLNNVAGLFDTNNLYNTAMDITRTGSSPFNYSADAGFEDKPIRYVSFSNAMRFANWLENGQPSGNQGAGTTETGVYTIGTGLDEVRTPGATYFLPSEDEWYKAAYYDPRPAAEFGPPNDDNYWLYPTRNEFAPNPELPPGGVNSGNLEPSVADTTDVGAYPGSMGFYGTFDQAGNVAEWTEALVTSSTRGLRGGGWSSNPAGSAATVRDGVPPASLRGDTGFRVASIPEPSAFVLLSLIGMCLGGARWLTSPTFQ